MSFSACHPTEFRKNDLEAFGLQSIGYGQKQVKGFCENRFHKNEIYYQPINMDFQELHTRCS